MAAFRDRIEALAAAVGTGKLVGSVEVDQVYAAYQHWGLDLNHPNGGQALYLEQPLHEDHPRYYQEIADVFLDGKANDVMAQSMESLSGRVEALAPIELGPLHFSGHPQVVDNGRTVYDRAPIVPRLTQAELNALRRAAEAATD